MLLILSAIIQLMVWTVTFVAVAHRILGLSVVYLTMSDIIFSCVVELEKLSCFTAKIAWFNAHKMYGCYSFRVYSGTPPNGHPSKADTHDITDNSESPDCPSIHFNT